MEDCACLWGFPCRQQRQGPAETTAADSNPVPAPAPAEKHMEADMAARCCAESGETASPMLPPRCSLLDLPVEMLMEIFALVPGSDLPSLAQACTKFHYILHNDSIWRRRCWEEYGVGGHEQDLEVLGGTSYREVYAKVLHPHKNLLGLWQLDTESYRTLLHVVMDGVGITAWTQVPSYNTPVYGPVRFKPSFKIRLTDSKSATMECMAAHHSRLHSCHMQIQKGRFTVKYNLADHLKDLPEWHREEWLRGLVQDRHEYDYLTYRRLYLPPSHPDDLIRPGLFQGNYDDFGLKIVMLSFHGKYARLTKLTGDSNERLQIHLMRRIQRPDEILHNFQELSRVVQEIDKQAIQEQQQQQQEDGTEESEGHGWQSPAQPSVRESGAAALEEQPVPFVLPEGMRSLVQNYPQTCRMCFYGVDTVTLDGFPDPRRFPGVFFLFDENHFGFIWLELKCFILYGRVQNTFQNVEAPSPQAFLEMLKDIQSGPSEGSNLYAL